MDFRAVVDAIRTGDLELVRARLAEPLPEGPWRDERGRSLVLLALQHEEPVIAHALAAKAPLDALEAAALGRVERLAELAESSPSALSEHSAEGFGALHLAAYFGRDDAVRWLLDHGTDRESVALHKSRVRPLHVAAARGAITTARILLDAGADPDATQTGGWSALHTAAHRDDRELAELLLVRGANPELAGDDGQTPKDVAAAGGNGRVAILLERGW